MHRLSIVLVVAGVAACGTDRVQNNTPATPRGTSGTGDAASLSAKMWCEGINVSLAGYYSRCFGGTTDEWRAQAGDVVGCTEVAEQVRQAKLSFDGAKGSDCSRAVAAASCGRRGLDIGSCESTLAGAISAGESCSDSEHCVEGTDCIIPADSCSGSCTLETRVAVGGSCAEARCAEGLTCFYDGSAGTRECKGLGNAGAACSFQSDCIDTLSCDGTTCAPAKPAGAACTGDYRECSEELVCAGPQGAQACRRPKKIGESCAPGDEECVVGYCTSDGVCGFSPTLGQACGMDGLEDPYCQEGYCTAEVAGICQAYKAAGAACQERAECSSFECSGGVCQAPECS